MGRLQEFMERMERGEKEQAPDHSNYDDILNQQKETDLIRARARSVARPIKKELRHSQIEGRYIRPEEVKKEIEKLEQAKREAEEKKRGLFRRIFSRRKKTRASENNTAEAVSETPEKRQADQTEVFDAEKKKKAEQIRRLRGIAMAKKVQAAKEAEERYLAVNGLSAAFSEEAEAAPLVREEGFIPQEMELPSAAENRSSFAEAFHRLNGQAESDGAFPHDQPADPQVLESFSFPEPADEAEATRRLFAPVPSHEPDRVIATALSAAVGFIYWEEDGQAVDRIITIRKLFSRQGDILIDAFCHDLAAPRLIPFSRGIRMYNLQTMKAYENPRDFLLYHVTGLTENGQLEISGFAAALSVVRYELTALVFVAKSDFDRTDEENRLMLTYISQRCPTIDFDEHEMLDYIAMLVPDEQSFAEALEIVVRQPQEIVFLFVRTFLQMMLSDGVLHENERELLAELLYLLQTEGIELSRIGLRI
ncbi:MAG: hypothetical protein IJ752_00315 [Alphaproteobacteria bacterium]|nr:hypothetical protein [Alphaproteobacteria bacterium]